MVDRWSWDDGVDEFELEEELVDLAGAGRGRKSRKRTVLRPDNEYLEDAREDRRKKRRWEAPPHKRVSDFEPV